MPALWESSIQTRSELEHWEMSQRILARTPILYSPDPYDDTVPRTAMISMQDNHECLDGDACVDGWNGSYRAMYWLAAEDVPGMITL